MMHIALCPVKCSSLMSSLVVKNSAVAYYTLKTLLEFIMGLPADPPLQE